VAVPVSRKPKRQHSGISSSGRETETGTAWAGAAAADDDIVLYFRTAVRRGSKTDTPKTKYDCSTLCKKKTSLSAI